MIVAYCTVKPPSITMGDPVILSAPEEHRNTTKSLIYKLINQSINQSVNRLNIQPISHSNNQPTLVYLNISVVVCFQLNDLYQISMLYYYNKSQPLLICYKTFTIHSGTLHYRYWYILYLKLPVQLPQVFQLELWKKTSPGK